MIDIAKARKKFCRFELKQVYVDALTVSTSLIRSQPTEGFEIFYGQSTKNELLAALEDMQSYTDALDRIEELEKLAIRERCLFLHARDGYPPIDVSAYETKAREILDEPIE